jgi:diguanylate cyclase (GGDEF)-like protein
MFSFPYTRLYYRELIFISSAFPSNPAVIPGPLYYPCFIYSFLTATAGTVMLIYGFRHGSSGWHARLFVVSIALPICGQIINFTGIMPNGLNILPTALTVSQSILCWYLYRYRRGEWYAMGREFVVQTMNEAFILVDPDHIVLDSNHKAQYYFPELLELHPGATLNDIPRFPSDALTESGDFEFETEIGGERLHLRLSRTALTFDGKSTGSCLLIHDYTENHLMMMELKRLARHDELTGLYNRSTFFYDSRRIFDLCLRQENLPGTALMMDIDNFKLVNDVHGHAAGDEVLRAVGSLLSSRMRHTDICGRYGGEEFCAWLPSTRLDGALVVAEDIRSAVEALEFRSDKGKFRVTISIGVASMADIEKNELEDLIKKADIALYDAKNSGRNTVRDYRKKPCAEDV